jgi:hypothetical protein
MMRSSGLFPAAALLVVLAPEFAAAQASSTASGPAPQPWAVGLSLTGNFFPPGRQSSFVQPTATVDHGWLHLEARWNYEALDSGSAWIGWNLSWGDTLSFSLTPMVGAVFGVAQGVAAGLEWDLRWGPLELTSTDEFVFDFANWPASDFNYWAEFHWWPWDWLKVGAALTHTRTIQTNYPVQVGPMVGFKVWKLDGAVYWMNPASASSQYWSATLGASF